MVLIGCHCYELSLSEDEGFEVLLGITLAIWTWIHYHYMETGLVSVHGIQDDLVKKRYVSDVH